MSVVVDISGALEALSCEPSSSLADSVRRWHWHTSENALGTWGGEAFYLESFDERAAIWRKIVVRGAPDQVEAAARLLEAVLSCKTRNGGSDA